MKIDPAEKRDEAPRPKPAASFQQALRAAPTSRAHRGALAGLQVQRGPPGPGLGATLVRVQPLTVEGLRVLRQGMHAEAQRLGEVRSELSGRSEQRHEQRATELIARELVRELSREAPLATPASARRELPPAASEGGRAEPEEPKVGGAGPRQTAAQEPAPAELRAEAALALIERIELFVRSQRPAMALSVGGALAATVEVERTGPREVALRIQGRNGPPAAQELAQLRTALEARGLQLRSLQVC